MWLAPKAVIENVDFVLVIKFCKHLPIVMMHLTSTVIFDDRLLDKLNNTSVHTVNT